MQKAKQVYKTYTGYAGAETRLWLITDGGIKCNLNNEKGEALVESRKNEIKRWKDVGAYFREENVKVRTTLFTYS